MQISKTLLAGLALASLTGQIRADQTVNLTGSSAFRAAVVKAILASYTGTAKVAFVSSLSGGNQQLFSGTIAGLPGTTYIRTCWNGSVEGVQSLDNPTSFPTTYIPITATVSNANSGNNPPDGGTSYGGALETATPSMAFSDVYQISTPVSDQTFSDDQVGVVPFKWVANEGSTVTNITTQLANVLLGTGKIALSQFTGNPADQTKTIYVTGRYNGSGTRASALAEVGYGVFNSVRQYFVATGGANTTITSLQFWPTGTSNPAGGTNDAIAGNGGYTSGGGIRDVIGCTMSGTTVTIKNAAGTTISTVSGSTVQLVSYLGLTDAASGNAAGHVDLNYNGVGYSAANVQNGFYTFWGYEHLLYGTLTSAEDTVRTSIENNISAALTFLGNGTAGTVNSPGLGLDSMTVGSTTISRSTDGGFVSP